MFKLLVADGLALLLFAITSLSLCSYHNTVKQFDVQPLPNDDDDVFTLRTVKQFNVQPLPSDDDNVFTLRTDLDDELECIYPTDCYDVMECGRNKSGVYRVFPLGVGDGFLVYCDMKSKGGGWLVFQRRQDGSVDFYRNWTDYTNGFGNVLGEFWLGLEKLHLLTFQRRYELLVNLGSYDNGTRYARYDRFYISEGNHQFQLLLGSYSGSAGDSLRAHNGYKFSTFDKDNDNNPSNCAKSYKGGWWYVGCHASNLNGPYFNASRQTNSNSKSACWYHWTNSYKSMQFVEMKLRPVL